jgi:hypothetical protein
MNGKQDQNERTIAQTLEITTNFAFKFLRKGKYRRAEKMADQILLQLPPKMRKSADASMLRMIGSSARHIADWYAAEDSARKRKKRAHRKQDKRPHVAELLLVPEPPGIAPAIAEPKLSAVD